MAAVEALLTSLQAVRSRGDADRGKALVGLRRQLSVDVAEIAAIARPILDRQDAATRNDFFRLHSTLLSKLALHQADWPAIRVVTEPAGSDYAQSARMVDEAVSAMGGWIRDWVSRG